MPADPAPLRPVRQGRHPWVFAVLYFPMGVMIGYPSVALGYLGNRAGLPVSTTAAIVGMAFFAHSFKFLWAPVGDYTLSRKRWYVAGVITMAAGMLALSVTPLTLANVPLLSALVLLSNIAGTFVAFATEGLMAHNTTPVTRGRAAGWFQSGNQLGQTGGGGLGLLLMKHLPQPWMAGVALGAVVMACGSCLLLLEEPPRPLAGRRVTDRARDAWIEMLSVIRSRAGRIGLLLATLPIGTGAAQFLFGSLGAEWHAKADSVSLVLGAGGGIAIIGGCLAGGVLAGRMNGARAYALSCAIGAVAALLMAMSPRTLVGFAASTLFYTFALGLCTATLTGMVLAIIGEGAAATKINLFFAMNTLFGLAMLRLDGIVHDRWATNGMLITEFVIGALSLAVFLALAPKIRGADRAPTQPMGYYS
ncbi:MAG: MFS transporter [Gemmatimonadota bacterium]|nr:MFS transporter [Gemmatimonadota bacterium]